MKHLIAIVLVVLSVGCGVIRPPRPPRPPVEPQPPPTGELLTFEVYVHDLMTPAIGLAAVRANCGGEERLTNPDGTAHFDVPSHQQLDCTFDKDGYDRQTASALPGVDARLQAWMHRTFVPPPPSARLGILRLGDQGYYDDSGPVLPLYAHAGDLFWLFTANRVRALQELDDVASAGYQGVRIWATLGCGPDTATTHCPGAFWQERMVGPSVTPDYWDQVRAFADALRERGLRAVWSQGDVGQLDRVSYMTTLAQIDRERPFIDFIDCGNEAWQTGEPDADALARCVGYYMNAGGEAIRSLTSPPGEGKAELDHYSKSPAQIFDVHSWRDGHSWDKRRHIFSIPYEGHPDKRFGIGSEPPGNGALVSVTSNKHELDDEAVPLLAVASMYSRQAFVWFSGEGVMIHAGLKTEAGFWTTPRTVGLLPRDVMSFSTLHHGGNAWANVRVLAAQGEGRVDCRTNGGDGRFVCTLDGPAGDYNFPVTRSFTGRLCNPGDGVCQDVSKDRGDVLPVSFTRGRVLIGSAQ